MNRNYFIIVVLIAFGCLAMIFISLGKEINSPLIKEPLFLPPRSPYTTYVAGVGVVESSSENIYIGSPVNRIIDEIAVTSGTKVKKGDVLFRLENGDLSANLKVEEVAYDSAKAKYKRLEAFPRPEDLSTANALLKSSQVELQLAKSQYQMVLDLPDPRALSGEEKNRRLYAYKLAQSKYEQVQADLEKTKLGTWKPDLEIADLELQQAKASVERIQAEIRRTVVRSPIDGTVLLVKAHVGEFPSQDSLSMPIMILGNTETLYLRVSINQFDIPNFLQTAPAVAFLQGQSKTSYPLEFVRIDPFLTNKVNLTNAVTETVDTRVLHIIYKIKEQATSIFVGQQMDVFIKINDPNTKV